MGQANVRRRVDDILPVLTDEDPLAVADLTTHEVPPADAPEDYKLFQERRDGCIKVILKP